MENTNKNNPFPGLDTETQEQSLESWEKKALYLLSTDTLGGYGLDLIFEVAKEVWFEGIDLAIWKNFDARNIDYVKRLSAKYQLPVKVIQTSASVNTKEMNQALDLCYALGTKVITINAPSFFDFSAYNFIIENISKLKKENPDIKFSIINPVVGNIFALPVPKFRFANVVDIIKKFWCYLGFDVANVDENTLEGEFMRKIDRFTPHMSVVYFSDKTKLGEGHVIPGEGVLKLTTILKKLRQFNYRNMISLKLSINKKDLADTEKVTLILKKCRSFHKDYFENITVDL